MRYFTIAEIKRLNKKAGQHFFDTDTLRFFRSRVSSIVYHGPPGAARNSSRLLKRTHRWAFVTSEKPTDDAPRRYTARAWLPGTGVVETIGDFWSVSRDQAHKAAKDYVDGKIDIDGESGDDEDV